MEELQVIETTSGRQFKPWATKDDVQDPTSVTAVASEIASGKQAIASAINAKGGEASATESFSELAQDIESIPLQVNELNTDMELSDVMAFINTKYNIPYKGYIAYMWEAVADTYTCILPTADLIVLSDGQTSTGGEVTIQLNPTQRFFFALLLYREGNTSATLASIGTARELNRVIVGGDMSISTISGFDAFDHTTLELGKNIVVGDLVNYAFYQNTHLNRLYIDLHNISGSNAFQKCTNLTSVEMPNLLNISGHFAFDSCSALQSVELPNLTTVSSNGCFQYCSVMTEISATSLTILSGTAVFNGCSALQEVNLPNLTKISGSGMFQNCTSLQDFYAPNLTIISNMYAFNSSPALRNVTFGTLTSLTEPFTNAKQNLRNITIGQDTNINLTFQQWTATNVIAEGQSGINELNANLQTNLISKLYQGGGKILRLGAALYDVTTQETRDMVTSKGWTLQRG